MHIQLLRSDMTSMKVDVMVSPRELESGPSLLCRFVIQVDVPSPAQPEADGTLQRITTESLQRAEGFAVASVGIVPLWSTPATAERCARNMLKAAVEFRNRARSLQRVVFCLFGQASYDLFDRVLQDLQS